MCQSGCKCVKPCFSCTCNKQGTNVKTNSLREMQGYFQRHKDVPLDDYYQKGVALLSNAA